MSEKDVQEAVREKYAAAARQAAAGGRAAAAARQSWAVVTPMSRDLYDASEKGALPSEAVAASLGCGNPSALAQLESGEIVLDLGSGGGIDVLLSAKRVGPTGKVYGLDMTDEMLALARENQKRAGVENVAFVKGTLEKIPLPDNLVDVIISNCVINLSGGKDRALREAFRVLKPGGRLAVSDVVIRSSVPALVRKSCVAGALQETEYREKLEAAGFEFIEVEPTRIYRVEEAREFLTAAGLDVDLLGPEIQDEFMSAFYSRKKSGFSGVQTRAWEPRSALRSMS